MLDRRLGRRTDEVELAAVVDRATLLEMQQAVEDVHVDESVGRYVVELVAATRESTSVVGRLEPARVARRRQALTLPCGARRAGLRHARTT